MKRKDADWGLEPDFSRLGHPGEVSPPIEEDRPPKDAPESHTAMRRIEYISRIHHMAFRSVLQKDSLPPAQIGAIQTIIRTPGMSQRELADELHIQRATATIMLQKMEKAGYVDRRPDPEDQRISRIYPTRTAIQLEEENRKAVDAYFDACFQGLSAEDYHHLDVILTTLGGNIRAILSQNPEPVNKE